MAYLADDYLKTKYIIKAIDEESLEITPISQEGKYESPFKEIKVNIIHQGVINKGQSL